MPIYKIYNISPIGGGNSIAGPLFFFISGYLISKTPKINIKLIKTLILLSLFCFSLRYYITYKYSYIYDSTYKGLFDYYYFTSIIPALTLFMVCKQYSPTPIDIKEKTKSIIKLLSSYSFGVYLLHKFIILIEQRILLKMNIDNYSWEFRFLMIPFTYIICILIVHIAKRTNIGRLIFP